MAMLGSSAGCGGPATEDEGAPVPRKPASRLCARCKAPATVAVRITAWCNDCFHRGFSARFGKAMEPAKMVSSEGIEVFEGRKPERRRNEPTPAKPPGKIVLAFSGGSHSRALLELVKTAYFAHLHSSPATEEPSAATASTSDASAADSQATVDDGGEPKKKKDKKKHGLARPPIFSECEVVFVDQSSVPGYGDDRTAEVRRIVEETAPYFRFTPLKLEDIFTLSPSLPVLQTTFSSPSLPTSSMSPSAPSESSLSPSAKDRLLALLSPSLLSPTALASLHTSLLSTLLRSHALQSGAETLLLGTNATRISILTLAGMAEGRSYAAGEEVAAQYIDRSLGGAEKPLLIVRPLALSLAKEVAYFSRTVREGGLDSLVMRDPTTSVSEGSEEKKAPVELKKKGIGALVEEFILSLEDDFPATVSTVVRTAHKLGLRSTDAAARAFADGQEEEAAGCNCVVCGMPAQPDAHAWRAAITISDLEEAKKALAASGAAAVSSLAALPSSSTTSASSTARPAKQLEPYQPSPAHLLADSSSPAADSSSPSADTASAVPGSVEPSEPSRSPRPTPDPSDPSNATTSLAPFLCYACLLIFQEPTATSLKPSARFSASTNADLPPYVAEAIQARSDMQRKRAERERNWLGLAEGEAKESGGAAIVGTKEVQGREQLREEVKEFLLVEDE
ncbi:hypothetical protein JCM11251_006866 [Rhodosporidiobolus azoricus]